MFFSSRNASRPARLRKRARSVAHRRGRRILTGELLETRRLLAVFRPLPGVADGAPESLRSAIALANENGEADTIELVEGVYRLTIENTAGQDNESLVGDLDFSEAEFPTTIVGVADAETGEPLTTITQDVSDRVLHVLDGASLRLHHLRIESGEAVDDGTASHLVGQSPGLGGGVLAEGLFESHNILVTTNTSSADGAGVAVVNAEVHLHDSTIQNNVALRAGGGLFVRGNFPTTIERSRILENNAGDEGGGIRVDGTRIAVFDSEISGNQSDSDGGGISIQFGELVAKRSTLSENKAFGDGGGLHGADSTIKAFNTTVSGNTVTGNIASIGGGIYHDRGRLTATNVTIANNRSNESSGSGGGLALGATSSPTIINSIVIGNGASDIASTNPIDGRYNLIGDPNSSGGLNHGEDGNIVGGAGPNETRVPLLIGDVLRPLADYGGYVPTHAIPSLDSPATGNGFNVFAVDDLGNALSTDARGLSYSRFVDFETNTGVDIGAFELQRFHQGPFVVSTLDDELDFNAVLDLTTDLSLREAIELANANFGPDEIQFADSLFLEHSIVDGGIESNGDGTGEILLRMGDLAISDDITIDGPGADRLTIQQNSGLGHRIFTIDDGSHQQNIDVEISGVRISGGALTASGPLGNGGAISSLENFTLRASHLTGNHASSLGGAVYSGGRGRVTIERSTIDNNTARFGGGAVINNESVIAHSTISSNSASNDGGGVFHLTGVASIRNSTITGNSANDEGGGIVSAEATTTLASTIVAGNDATTQNDLLIFGGKFSGVSNLIGDPGSAAGFVHASDGNIVGRPVGNSRDDIVISSILEPLSDNGGSTPTHRLFVGSVAIDAGLSAELTDQRGSKYFRNDGGGVDIGAYERQTANDQVLVVTTANDELDSPTKRTQSFDRSLREAVLIAAQSAGEYVIRIDDSIDKPLLVALGEIDLTKNIVIEGNGVSTTQIDAGDLSRVFNLEPSTDVEIGDTVTITLDKLSITGGRSVGSGGGAIRSASSGTPLTLRIRDSVLSGNTAVGSDSTEIDVVDGGAIFAENTNVEIIRSLIRSNSATGFGGAVKVQGNKLLIVESEITDNSAGVRGGGFWAETADVTLQGSKVDSNQSLGGGFRVNAQFDEVLFDAVPQSENAIGDGFAVSDARVNLLGGDADDRFLLNFAEDSLSDDLSLGFDGAGGTNTLEFANAVTPIDLTEQFYRSSNFATIQLGSLQGAEIHIDGDAISRLAQETEVIQIGGDHSHLFHFADQTDWRMGSPQITNGVFLRSLVNEVNPSPRTIEAGLPLAWQNLIDHADVNNDGELTALDALVIINELTTHSYSASNGLLANPLGILVWPSLYFDVSGDNKVTAFDALQVINLLSFEGNSNAILDDFADRNRGNGEWIPEFPDQFQVDSPDNRLQTVEQSLHDYVMGDAKTHETLAPSFHALPDPLNQLISLLARTLRTDSSGLEGSDDNAEVESIVWSLYDDLISKP